MRYNGEINQHKRLIRAQKIRIFQVLTNEKAIQEIYPEGTNVTHKSSLLENLQKVLEAG